MAQQITQPTPNEIKTARVNANLTQSAAAETVHAAAKTWRNWESDSGEARKIPLASWELFLIKTGAKTV